MANGQKKVKSKKTEKNLGHITFNDILPYPSFALKKPTTNCVFKKLTKKNIPVIFLFLFIAKVLFGKFRYKIK